MSTDAKTGESFSIGDEYEPHVRYATLKNGSPRQSPFLNHVSEPIPENAVSVSPLYFLSDEQASFLSDVVNPWVGTSNAAKTLQDDCEDDERVLYPVHVEGRDDSLPVQMQDGSSVHLRTVGCLST